MFKHILVPTDGSEFSNSAVQKAIDFAVKNGAMVTFFYAMPESPLPVSDLSDTSHYEPEKAQNFIDAAQMRAAKILDAAVEHAKQYGVKANAVTEANDSPYVAIIRTADEQGCDLIFMASHGRRGMNALLLGSETQKVLTHCGIPVLVFR